MTAQTYCCINITTHGGANEGEQCPANLCPSFDDPPVSPPFDFHVAFEGWSIRSLLFSSSSLFHLTLPLHHFSFGFLSHAPPPFLLFVAFFRAMPSFFNSLHPLKMCTCTISFLFNSCSWGFFCP